MLAKIGLGELILILGVALVIFGPDKLPELGKSMGESIGSFRNSVDKFEDDLKGGNDSDKKS